MDFSKIVDALARGAQGVLAVAPVMAAVGIIFGAVTLTGLAINLSVLIRELAGGSLLLLAIFTWLFMYMSGFGIGEIITYIVMSIIVAPAFVDMGVPVLAAHMFIVIAGVSMFITPPNCPAVFVACSIAGSGMWRTAFQAMKLGIVAFIMPFLLVFDPVFVLIGSPVSIAVAMVAAIIGALFLAAGIEGYLLAEASWWQRLLFVIGGLGLFIPGAGTDLIGLVLIIPVAAQVRAWRLAKQGLEAPLKETASHKAQ